MKTNGEKIASLRKSAKLVLTEDGYRDPNRVKKHRVLILASHREAATVFAIERFLDRWAYVSDPRSVVGVGNAIIVELPSFKDNPNRKEIRDAVDAALNTVNGVVEVGLDYFDSIPEPAQKLATKKYRVTKSGSQFDEGHVFETDTENAIGAFTERPGNPFRILIPWEFLEEVKEPAQESILETAMRITKGDRQNAYGPPDQDFVRIAKMWSAIKGVEFEPREVALFMILVKVSRETHQRKTDNWVDIAGYAHCGSICQK